MMQSTMIILSMIILFNLPPPRANKNAHCSASMIRLAFHRFLPRLKSKFSPHPAAAFFYYKLWRKFVLPKLLHNDTATLMCRPLPRLLHPFQLQFMKGGMTYTITTGPHLISSQTTIGMMMDFYHYHSLLLTARTTKQYLPNQNTAVMTTKSIRTGTRASHPIFWKSAAIDPSIRLTRLAPSMKRMLGREIGFVERGLFHCVWRIINIMTSVTLRKTITVMLRELTEERWIEQTMRLPTTKRRM
mmetsp:Transcript_14588/g.31740  ORF Transcript_14588/g.31740 Transcript_14588/m.31740 type:complete len:244 (+) Transcript_14588:563-1294(+)